MTGNMLIRNHQHTRAHSTDTYSLFLSLYLSWTVKRIRTDTSATRLAHTLRTHTHTCTNTPTDTYTHTSFTCRHTHTYTCARCGSLVLARCWLEYMEYGSAAVCWHYVEAHARTHSYDARISTEKFLSFYIQLINFYRIAFSSSASSSFSLRALWAIFFPSSSFSSSRFFSDSFAGNFSSNDFRLKISHFPLKTLTTSICDAFRLFLQNKLITFCSTRNVVHCESLNKQFFFLVARDCVNPTNENPMFRSCTMKNGTPHTISPTHSHTCHQIN